MTIYHIGQISASLTSFSRTIDDYAEMAKKELIPAKQEKAQERIKNFRGELGDYRQALEQLKRDKEDSVRIVDTVRSNSFEPKAPWCKLLL